MNEKKVIGIDKSLESHYKQLGAKKVQLATSVIELFYGSHLDIEDYSELAKGFVSYADNMLRKLFIHLPMEVSTEHLAALVDLDLKRLQKYWSEFNKIHIELNEDLSQYIVPNCDITIQTDREYQRYEIYKQIKHIVQQLKNQGAHINVNDLNRILPVFQVVNPIGLEVNVSWLKQ
jgi:hypothetical protein